MCGGVAIFRFLGIVAPSFFICKDIKEVVLNKKQLDYRKNKLILRRLGFIILYTEFYIFVLRKRTWK